MREIKFRAWVNGMMEQKKSGVYGTKEFLDQLYEDCILMQYTGLKDKKGKEIYEGDIVKDVSANFEQIVEYDNGAFIKRNRHQKHSTPIDIDIDWYEIIGNIYENKEILEKGGK